MADGSIRIETEIDESGLMEGLERLGTLVEQAAQSLQAKGLEAAAMFAGALGEGLDAQDVPGAYARAAEEAAQAAEGALSAGTGHAVGAQFAAGLADGIASGEGAIARAAEEAARAAYDAAISVLDVHSPSRAMAWVGRMFAEGFAGGIEGAQESAVRAAGGLSAAAAEALSGQAGAAVLRAHAQQGASLPATRAERAAATSAGDTQVTIQQLSVNAAQLSQGQDWALAGRRLSESFARKARLKGIPA